MASSEQISTSRSRTLAQVTARGGLVLLCGGLVARGSSPEPWDRVPPIADGWISDQLALGDATGSRFTPSGHARTMVEVYRNPDFGLGGYSRDSWLHQRLQLGLAIDFRDRIEWFTELTWGDLADKEQPAAPPDRDDPDLLQLYLQARQPFGDSHELVVRVGRQVLYYGSGRLIAHREGANQRLTHDAVRLSLRRSDSRWQVDGLLASPVEVKPDAFDNQSHAGDVLLWGVYGVGPAPWSLGGTARADLYYLGLRAEESLLAGARETELRHTVGMRWWDKAEPWTFNHELIFQFGDAAARTIMAGAASLGAGYVWDFTSWKLTLGIKGDAISGGDATGRVHTFNPLFQTNNYFNEGGYVSPSNLYNLNPLVTIEPHRCFSITGGVNFLWRFSGNDFVYGPPFTRVAPPAADGERFLGTATNLSANWTPHPAIELAAGYTHHFAGESLTAVGGRDVDYFQTSFRIRF